MRKLVYIVIHGVLDGYYEIDSVWSDKKTANKRCDDLNEELQEEAEFGTGMYNVIQEIVKPRNCYKEH